jgi:MFS family permease
VSIPVATELIRRRNGVFLLFGIAGFIFANWAARLPGIRDNLDISPAEVGLFLFGGAAGAILGLAFAAHVIAYLGERRTMLIFMLTALGAVGVVGIVSVYLPSLWIALSVMVFFGIGASTTDVAMNIEGAEVERELGRTIMPWFHALFSLGTAIGGGLAATASALAVPVDIHLGVIALALMPLTVYSVQLMGGPGTRRGHTEGSERSTVGERLGVWKEGRTILIGLVGLSMALAEGSANDWLALGMVDDRGFSNATGALWFVLFVSAMTAGRVVGVPLIDKVGRVAALRLSAISAFAGLALLILIENTVVSVIAVVLWGLGSALGFPVAMSAAADDQRKGAARVSAVATLAYGAFLIGPPIIGALAEVFGVLNSLWVVAALVAAGYLAIPATKKQDA